MKEYKNKFLSVIRDDEEILWAGGINKSAYLKTTLRNIALFGLFPMFFPFMLLALTIFIFITISLINQRLLP